MVVGRPCCSSLWINSNEDHEHAKIDYFSLAVCYYLSRFSMEPVILSHWVGLVCFTALYSEAHIHGAAVSHFFLLYL